MAVGRGLRLVLLLHCSRSSHALLPLLRVRGGFSFPPSAASISLDAQDSHIPPPAALARGSIGVCNWYSYDARFGGIVVRDLTGGGGDRTASNYRLGNALRSVGLVSALARATRAKVCYGVSCGSVSLFVCAYAHTVTS